MTSTKTTPSDDLVEITNLVHRPVAVQDIMAMLKRPERKNDPPYTAEALRCNNDIVQEWHDKVLTRISDAKGCVRDTEAQVGLQIFVEGKEIHAYMNVKDKLPFVDESLVDYWIKTLKGSTVSEMKKIGTFSIIQGYQYLTDCIRRKGTEQKWEAIYKDSDDPYDWHTLGMKQSKLFSSDVDLPYGLVSSDMSDILDKVRSLVSNPIEAK